MKSVASAIAGLILVTSPALAGSLSAPEVEPVPLVPAASAFNWDGFYAGGSIGRTDATADSLAVGSLQGPHLFDLRGTSPALHFGFNHVLSNNLLVGLELGVSAGGVDGIGEGWNGNGFPSGAPTATHKIDNMLSLSARFGVVMGDVLPYVTAGLATANATRHTVYQDQTAKASHSGFTVGAGVEWGFAPSWSLRGEVRYFDLGDKLYEFDSGNSPTVKLTGHTIRIGVSKHF